MSRIHASSRSRSTSSMSGPRSARADSLWPVPTTIVTGSKRRTARATPAQAARPSASSRSSVKVGLGPGQAIQVRSCGAHSAGMWKVIVIPMERTAEAGEDWRKRYRK